MPAAKAKSPKADAPDLLTSALEVVGEAGWRGFTFAALADRTGLSLAEIRDRFKGRADLLDQLSRRLDRAMLAVEPDEMDGLPPRDRVFELIMRRLEAMAPLRAGLLRLMQDARFDPPLLAFTACRLDRSMTWLQDAAGLADVNRSSPIDRLRRRVQRRLLGAVYLQTLKVWASDDSVDLAKTMASLDKQLRRIEGLAGLGKTETRSAAA